MYGPIIVGISVCSLSRLAGVWLEQNRDLLGFPRNLMLSGALPLIGRLVDRLGRASDLPSVLLFGLRNVFLFSPASLWHFYALYLLLGS